MAAFYKSKVVSNQKLNYKFHLLRFQLQGNPDLFQFKAGQFVAVKVGRQTFRSYSVASSPNALPFWEIFVDTTPQGPGSCYLQSLKVGDLVEATGPKGVFTLEENPALYSLMVATGCGLASIRPMVKELLRQNPQSHIFLLWGLRFSKDIVLLDELKSWEEQYPNLRCELVLSKPEVKWSGKTGHVTQHLASIVKTLPPHQTHIYLCGNSSMIEDVNKTLKEVNFPLDQIFFERYY